MSVSRNLMMFGGVGSGKTLMIHALSRSLHHLSGKEGNLSAYEIKETLGSSAQETSRTKIVPWYWQPIEASGQRHTEDFKETHYQMEYKAGQSVPTKYEFSVFDGRGVLFMNILTSNLRDDVLKSLENVDGVIALLAVDQLSSRMLDELEMLARVMVEQKEKQMPARVEPKTWPSRKPLSPKKTKLAVCLHKMDLLNMRWGHPDQMFRAVFGNVWNETKLRLEKVSSLEICPFVTSSLGFYLPLHDPCELPNSVSADGRQIKFPEKWLPWNVEHPFLWILQDRKKEDLRPYW